MWQSTAAVVFMHDLDEYARIVLSFTSYLSAEGASCAVVRSLSSTRDDHIACLTSWLVALSIHLFPPPRFCTDTPSLTALFSPFLPCCRVEAESPFRKVSEACKLQDNEQITRSNYHDHEYQPHDRAGLIWKPPGAYHTLRALDPTSEAI